MVTIYYDWLAYCIDHNDYVVIKSDTVPTLCPLGGTIDTNNVVIIRKYAHQTEASDLILFDSGADEYPAIQIEASGASGGVNLKAGNNEIILKSEDYGKIDILSQNINLGPTGPCKMVFGTDQAIIFERYGSGDIKYQGAEVGLLDQDATLTISQILVGLFTITTTANRTLTIDSAANLVAGVTGLAVNDAVDFIVINLGSNNVIIASVDGTILSGMNVTIGSGLSGNFRIRFTNITTPAYTLYRL